MDILHVDDDTDWHLRIVKPAFADIGVKNVFHASNAEDTYAVLESQNIDYVVLDLSIPSSRDSNDENISNGLALGSFIRNTFPGTPILILTGQSTEEASEQFVEDQERTIFWDGNQKQLVKIRGKLRFSQAIRLLETTVSELASVEDIQINLLNCDLDQSEKRVIKLFCKEQKAIAADVASIQGGLSSSKVLRVTLYNNSGNEFFSALSKIDVGHKIDREDINFHKYITKLAIGSFPIVLNKYYAGCGKKKGVFYQFAFEHSSNYFECLIKDESKALSVLKRLKQKVTVWQQNSKMVKTTIAVLRERLCSQEKLEFAFKFLDSEEIKEFEKHCVDLYQCIQHCDLHGENILVSDELEPILIDYYDVREDSSVIDIVTLELSPYFHPSIAGSIKVDLELFENWFDKEKYLEYSQFKTSAEFLRNWAVELGFMNRQYVTTVYTYAMRQFSYENTNKDYAIALIKSCIAKFGQN